MSFKLYPILNEMKALYKQARSPQRFKEYINKLQGESKGDMRIPISGFNPMAKYHILDKINELQVLGTEDIIQETIARLNQDLTLQIGQECTIVLNIADDLKGGWTNFYTTDFDSKFKLNAFVSRGFCVPYFWTSENYTKDLIEQRVNEYALRFIYWLNHSKPQTLQDHFKQELYVTKLSKYSPVNTEEQDLKQISTFYEQHKLSEDYNIIFNFFYGDKGANSLGFKSLGLNGMTGFEYAQHLARNSN